MVLQIHKIEASLEWLFIWNTVNVFLSNTDALHKDWFIEKITKLSSKTLLSLVTFSINQS